jgi:hypothetical protein
VKFKHKQVEDKMGLDMYAYVGNPGQRDDYWYKSLDRDSTVNKPRDIAYWRKHPNLHGWMEQLWVSKGKPGRKHDDSDFNGIELELTWEDVDALERAVRHGMLPSTEGFFFGNPSDDVYYERDLEFCVNAKTELFLGLRVFYNSSW